MTTYNEALNILFKTCKKSPMIELALEECLGMTAAEDVQSPENHPAFNFAARDGFAIKANDICQAMPNQPIRLTITNTIIAGPATSDHIDTPGTCCEIMTGACIPAMYDTIVPIEDVVVEKNSDHANAAIRIDTPILNNDFHRKIGSDIRKGTTLLSKGETITPFSLMQLSTVGVSKLNVFQVPTVVLICTGDEIVDDPGSPLLPGQVRNASAPFIAAECKALHCNFHYIGVLQDEESVYLEKLNALLQQYSAPLIIISTGAISLGQKDFIPNALKKINATIHLQDLSMKPGAKFLYATLDDQVYYFGLPGTPSSSVLLMQRLVMPFINKLCHAPNAKAIKAKIKHGYVKTLEHEEWVASTLDIDEQGQLWVTPNKLLEPYRRIYQLYKNNCWMHLPVGEKRYDMADIVDTYLIQPKYYGLEMPLTQEHAPHSHKGCC